MTDKNSLGLHCNEWFTVDLGWPHHFFGDVEGRCLLEDDGTVENIELWDFKGGSWVKCPEDLERWIKPAIEEGLQERSGDMNRLPMAAE